MVQNEYVRLIKEGSYLNNLLTLIFDFLVGSRNKALDPSQYEIETYDPGTEGSPEKHFNWLLVHLYYLSLKHLPALARAWWRDDCSRQLQKSVDEWTTDHVSKYVARNSATRDVVFTCSLDLTICHSGGTLYRGRLV